MDEENTYELIGRATVAWSDVELSWYLIYLALSAAPRSQADALHSALVNSATERKVTLSLAQAALAEHPLLIDELGTLLKETNRNSSDRNAVAHGKYIFSTRDRENKSVNLWSVGKNKLIGKPLDDELKRMEADFLNLADNLLTFVLKICVTLGTEPPSIEA